MYWIQLLGFMMLLQNCGETPKSAPQDLKLHYIANEGVFLRRGDTKVLIDALHDPYLSQYQATESEVIDELMQNKSLFANTMLLLITHVHGDHFDPRLTDRLMLAQNQLVLIAPQQACDSLANKGERMHCLNESTDFNFSGVKVRTQLIQHSYPQRNHWVQNVAYLLDFEGIRVLHIGDANVSKENFASLSAFTKGKVDVAILPCWYYTDPASAEWIQSSLQARIHLAVHVPKGGYKELRIAKKRFPNLVIANKEMEEIHLSALD